MLSLDLKVLKQTNNFKRNLRKAKKICLVPVILKKVG